VNNLPKVVTQQRRGRASNPRLIDRKSERPTTKPPVCADSQLGSQLTQREGHAKVI